MLINGGGYISCIQYKNKINMWAWVSLLYSCRQLPHKFSLKPVAHIVPVVDPLLYPSHNTPNTSRGKSQVLRYIRHKWVIDKSLPTPHACAPFIQPKYLTCVSYSFNIWLALCPAHLIASDCWTLRARASEPFKREMEQRVRYPGPGLCVYLCDFSLCVLVCSIMCLIS